MVQSKLKNPTAELLSFVYQSVRRTSDSILSLMPRVEDEELKSEMTVQISIYDGFASRAAKLLAKEGEAPEGERLTEKMATRMGAVMHTLRDRGEGHLAELLIEDAREAKQRLTEEIREAIGRGVCDEPLHLAQRLCAYEQKRVEDLGVYLSGASSKSNE